MRYTGFHRAIAIFHRELRRSWPICFCNQIDTARLETLRTEYRDAGLPPPSWTALVVKGIGLGIRNVMVDYPEINSMLTGLLGWKTIHAFDCISAGVAISRNDNGADRAMQSVIQNPDQTSLSQITDQLHEYATRAVKDVPYLRNCHYLYRVPRPVQELMLWSGRTLPETRRKYRGTFSLTSVGKFGVDYQLTLPQTACLQFGFGSVRERPVVRQGKVVAGQTFNLTLSFDRRLMNGKPCALLMERVRDVLNDAAFDDHPENECGVPATSRPKQSVSKH